LIALAVGLVLEFGRFAPLLAKPAPRRGAEVPGAFRQSGPASVADLRAMERHVEGLVRRVSPAVVAVRIDNSAGSGVVISQDGLVLTAAHVCGTPDRAVLFTFPDGRTAHGHTLGTNHDRDSGLMKITDPGPWPHVDLADPSEMRLGEWVLALGHPGGFDPDRATVARLGRVIRTGILLQTDCTLMAGDSGGPLFDMAGRVVGVHSRISESTAENFHVPIATYLETWDRLERGDNWGGRPRPSRSTIGVHGIDDPEGCRIQDVVEDGPAWRAGVQTGDVILRINGVPITDAECLGDCVHQAKPGEELAVLVKRHTSQLILPIVVQERRGFPGRGGRPRP
jgi:serine protease Do